MAPFPSLPLFDIALLLTNKEFCISNDLRDLIAPPVAVYLAFA